MTTNHHRPDSLRDDLDRLLTAYFRAEMPARWPAAPRPTTARTAPQVPARPEHAPARSRWALAASVALLIGGCWFLADQATDGKAKSGPGLEATTANVKAIKDLAAPPKPGPGMP